MISLSSITGEKSKTSFDNIVVCTRGGDSPCAGAFPRLEGESDRRLSGVLEPHAGRLIKCICIIFATLFRIVVKCQKNTGRRGSRHAIRKRSRTERHTCTHELYTRMNSVNTFTYLSSIGCTISARSTILMWDTLAFNWSSLLEGFGDESQRPRSTVVGDTVG